MTEATTPTLSAILLTPDRFDRLRQVIAALQSQTIRDQLEIVLVAPSSSALAFDEQALAGFNSYQVVLLGKPMLSTSEARAVGIRAARAPVIVLCEDHCFPDPTWAEHLVAAHRQSWAAVGPAVRNGDPISLVSWADFFIGYSEWAVPTTSGKREHLPGHNSSYKRDLLLGYGSGLANMLNAESVLHWDLRRQGYELFLQADAVTSHINFSKLTTWIVVHRYSGRSFAALRAASWPRHRRLLYAAASPLIPLVRLRRIWREIRKPGRFDGALLRLGVLVILGLLNDGIGQMIGYAFGPGQVTARLSYYELYQQRVMPDWPAPHPLAHETTPSMNLVSPERADHGRS